MLRWDRRQARISLLLFLALFSLGLGRAFLARPLCPDLSRLQAAPWPPEGCLLDATAAGKALVASARGTTVFSALSGLGLAVDPVGSGFVLPRAGVLVRTGGGWGVRRMTQRERWLWRIPMDVHSCTPGDFSRIRGIGPSLAGKIHSFVRERRSLDSIDDLLEVPGVGPSRLEILRTGLALD